MRCFPTRVRRHLGLLALSLSLTACGMATTSQSIRFTSHPSGAVVTVNGERIGMTSTRELRVDLPRDQDHAVMFEKDGYLPTARSILSEEAPVAKRQSPTDAVAATFLPSRQLNPEHVYVQLVPIPVGYDEPAPVIHTPTPTATPVVEKRPLSIAERMSALARDQKAGRITPEEFELRKQAILSGN